MQIQIIDDEISAHIATARALLGLKNQINAICDLAEQTIKNGKKIIICGNGGSAADAQHFAAELTGRYKTERRGLPAISLSTDTSALTAIGNDYGFEFIFSRQLEAIGNEGDLLFGISTSGNSKNVINAIQTAKKMGIKTVGLSGKDGGSMCYLCDLNLAAPSSSTPRIQEMHILIIHIICRAMDEAFS